ncbi:unnamed protein product [Paramecium primaurelia]|uniref:Uncharacterized protein n=1 Tax=Paramecium primaurelia TaxID=5886 RepID=A0A8S1MEI5_PARPR|nr:unnamed protein product [Paramecium primaurelia]
MIYYLNWQINRKHQKVLILIFTDMQILNKVNLIKIEKYQQLYINMLMNNTIPYSQKTSFMKINMLNNKIYLKAL